MLAMRLAGHCPIGVAPTHAYLHTRELNIVHGDMQPTSMLIEQPHGVPRANALDFGLARGSGAVDGPRRR